MNHLTDYLEQGGGQEELLAFLGANPPSMRPNFVSDVGPLNLTVPDTVARIQATTARRAEVFKTRLTAHPERQTLQDLRAQSGIDEE
ncbi:MAG: hypothetical protein GY776_00685 [Alteromonas sp.]|nr:hypothetical protein [Alteromonas sp.]